MNKNVHTFHIPVMGTAFTIDTPLKVAKYGISSVVSIGDDELCETMHAHYAKVYGLPFTPIKKGAEDYRARRICGYLNLLNKLVNEQFDALKKSPFEEGSEITTYFQLLPEDSELKVRYNTMLGLTDETQKNAVQEELRGLIKVGAIDVNIMTKLDRDNYDENGELLPMGFSDALAALRGYAQSDVSSSIVFSAGFNRRLYAYCEEFSGFFPDEHGQIKKRIVLKVSDFRSSVIQGKFLAKKGLWVSEYRIESGLNCGGHAFATEGLLMGPILEEFREKKSALFSDLYTICNQVLDSKNKSVFSDQPYSAITVQGGIGTYDEDRFLQRYYDVDGTGWATPFLLVPEATVLDSETRQLLVSAKEEDTYLSGISPLGIPFNTVKGTASESLKLKRAYEDNRPGSPCPKGYLVSDTTYSKKPVCKASIFYQKRAVEALKKQGLSQEEYDSEYFKIIDKACLCEDLAASSLIENKLENKRPLKTAVCPGPNIAYFTKLSSLKDMVGHIYGRLNLIQKPELRPNMFVKELKMYIQHIEKEIISILPSPDLKQVKSITEFKDNLLDAIDYYKELMPTMVEHAVQYSEQMKRDIAILKLEIDTLIQKYSDVFTLETNLSATPA